MVGPAPAPPFGAFAPTKAQDAVIKLVRRSFLHRGLWRPLLAKALDRLRPGPLDVDCDIGRYRLHYQDNLIELGILLHPAYNGVEIAFLREALSGGGCFVDIGANVGLYSLGLAVQEPGARVLAIEPGLVALARLHTNIAASDVAERVTVCPCAVSDAERTGGLVFRHGDLAIARFEAGLPGGLRSRPLLSLLAEQAVAGIEALKIDIEGGEGAALGPFFREAPRALWPRRMVIEHLHDDLWGIDLLSQMFEGGYRQVGRTRQNALLQLD